MNHPVFLYRNSNFRSSPGKALVIKRGPICNHKGTENSTKNYKFLCALCVSVVNLSVNTQEKCCQKSYGGEKMTYMLIVSLILVGYLGVASRPEFAYGRTRMS